MLVREPVLLRVYYFLPDYINLKYWHSHIDAVIASIDLDPYKEHIYELQGYAVTYRQ